MTTIRRWEPSKTDQKLVDAIKENNLEGVEIALKEGANINFQNHTILPPIYHIETQEMAQLLVDKGANVNLHIWFHDPMLSPFPLLTFTALHFFAEKGLLGVVKVFIKEGADVFAAVSDHVFSYKDNKKMTPYDVAVKAGHTEIAKILKEAMENQLASIPSKTVDEVEELICEVFNKKRDALVKAVRGAGKDNKNFGAADLAAKAFVPSIDLSHFHLIDPEDFERFKKAMRLHFIW